MEVIKNNFSKPNNNITYYLNPDYIFIPTDKINVNQNDYIYKLGSVGVNHSTVSGRVIGVKQVNILGKRKKTIVIENDYREYTKHEEIKKSVTIPNILKLLEKDSVLFKKFKSHKTFDNIIVKAYSDNVFLYNEVFLLKENLIDVLDFINKLSLLYKTSNNMLVIKNNDAFIINECLNVIGSYPTISLSLTNNDVSQTSNTLELSISEVIKISNLFKGRIQTTKLITITGDNVDTKVIRVKINTLLSDVIGKFIKIYDKDYDIIINSLLNGVKVNSLEDIVITEDVDSIFIMKKIDEETHECIKCGKCLSVCKNSDKCNSCGMCSYVCPCKRSIKTTSFIHKKILKTYIINYILCLIPLYLYGLYKNGILLYNKDLISFILIPKILYYPLLGVISYYLTNKLLKKKNNYDLVFLSLFVIPLFLPPNTNLLLYFIIMFISLLFRKYYNITFIVLLLSILSSYKNVAEASGIYSFSTLDLLMGRNTSGIGVSSIILVILISFILSNTNLYKKNIAISSICSFIVLSLIFQDFNYLLIGNIYGGVLLLGGWLNITPVNKNEMLYYGLILGIITYLATKFINIYYGVFISIFITSTIYYFVDKYKIFDKIKLGRKNK